MENIIKGDKVLNSKTNVEYVVDIVETHGDVTVVFTEGHQTTCHPISDIIKIPKSWLANFLLKKINKSVIDNFEEKKFDESLRKLELVKIKKFDPIQFEKMIKGLD